MPHRPVAGIGTVSSAALAKANVKTVAEVPSAFFHTLGSFVSLWVSLFPGVKGGINNFEPPVCHSSTLVHLQSVLVRWA